MSAATASKSPDLLIVVLSWGTKCKWKGQRWFAYTRNSEDKEKGGNNTYIPRDIISVGN